jgi:hypothetical protein
LTPGVGLGYALHEGWHIKRRRKVMAQGGWQDLIHDARRLAAIAIESVVRAAHVERLVPQNRKAN